jgi:hypothetical protein
VVRGGINFLRGRGVMPLRGIQIILEHRRPTRSLLRNSILLGLLLSFTSACQNRAIDYTLLVGEWAQRGQCDKLRNAYTHDGRYQWLENASGKWLTQNDGLYVPVPEKEFRNFGVRERGAITIFIAPQQDGLLIQIQALNDSRYRGYWDTESDSGVVISFNNPKDAFFDYVRCPNR